MQYNLEALVRLTEKTVQDSYGYNIVPLVITTTTTAATGEFIYAVKAIDGDAVITSAVDINGATVSGLAGVTIKQGDILQFPLNTITLTSGKLVVYKTVKLDNIIP